MSCAHCTDAGRVFGRPLARFELFMYRLFGPRRSTAFLVESVRSARPDAFSLLDVGGGIGAVQHRLADRMVDGTAVDASPAYVTIAERQAERHGYRDRMSFLSGDFLDVADGVGTHDVVTLDRVLCCYPDVEGLVSATARRARSVYGLVFPRERRINRILFGGTNLLLRLRGSAFRTYVHPTARIDGAATAQGLRLSSVRRTFMWQVRLYERPGNA